MITWGINALNHDASIAVFNNSNLAFFGRSATYTGIPGDQRLCSRLMIEAIESTNSGPDNIVWYERPWLKKFRQLRAGQFHWAFDLDELPSRYLKSLKLGYAPISYVPHHLSHAAAGFLTSPFEEATVVVLDAIGEFESATIWKGQGTDLKKIWSRSYPTSLGLFYSAFTHLLEYTPVKEEHLLQQLSKEGVARDKYFGWIESLWGPNWKLNYNLHRGVPDWPYTIDDKNKADIAATVQSIFETRVQEVMNIAKDLNKSNNLVYMGGCAMNSKFNERLPNQWNGLWSLPIPGDASSAIGCVLWNKKIRINWPNNVVKHLQIKYN